MNKLYNSNTNVYQINLVLYYFLKIKVTNEYESVIFMPKGGGDMKFREMEKWQVKKLFFSFLVIVAGVYTVMPKKLKIAPVVDLKAEQKQGESS